MEAREQHLSVLAMPVVSLLSLGVMCAWTMLGWPTTGDAIGALDVGSACKLAERVMLGLTFLVLAVLAGRASVPREPACLAACAACVGASVALRIVALGVGSDVLNVLSAALVGPSYALFSFLWFSRLVIAGRGAMFAALLFATGFGNYLYVTAVNLDSAHSVPFAICLPVAALTLTDVARRKGLLDAGAWVRDDVDASTPGGRQFWCQATALLLCAVAGGITSRGIGGGGSGLSFYVVALVTLALGGLVVLVRLPRSEFVIAGSVVYASACVILSLLTPDHDAWGFYLARAGFWVLIVYALEWFARLHLGRDGALSPTALRCLGALYLTSAFADVIGGMLTGQTAGIVALLTLVASLVLVVLSMGAREASEPPDAPESTSTPPRAHDIDESVALIAVRHNLTPAESAMLACLAKGYSLKRAAEDMVVSESMAKYHRHNVYQKLGISSRQELINMVESYDAGDDTSPRA